MWTRTRLWLAGVLRRRRFDRDLSDEVAFHIQTYAERLQRQGVAPQEAQRRARLEFGAREKVKDQVREVRAGVWFEQLRQDLRYGARVLLKRPGFTAAATLTLALGIGATATVFALLEVVLLRPLPVHSPDELAHIYTSCRAGNVYCASSYPEFLDYRSQSRAFSDMAAFQRTGVNIGDGDRSWVAGAMLVTTNYFTLLGMAPQVGQFFSPGWDVAVDPVLVLSHRAWSSRFGSDPGVVGRAVNVSGALFRIVGVAPPEFSGTRLTDQAELWVPMENVSLLPVGAGRDQLAGRDTRWIGGTIGRLRSGVTLAQAQADMTLISDGLQASDPSRLSRFVTVEPARRAALPPTAAADLTRFVVLLMAGVLGTLFIACANIAGLLLARGSARRREFEMRRALGASRGRLIHQLFAEYLLLAFAGAIGGLLVARGAMVLLTAYELPGAVPIGSLDLGLNGRVLAFATILLVATAFFGLLPALGVTRGISSAAPSRTVGEAGGSVRGQGLLLTAQVAVTVILLFGAGLFIRSLQEGLALDLGLDSESVATIEIAPSLARYTPERTWEAIERARARLAGMPGLREVSIALFHPLNGGNGFLLQSIDGYSPAPGEEMRIEANFVTAGYFSALGVEILEGRELTDADREGSPHVAVVSETLARRYWPGRSPVGLRMTSRSFPEPLEIVGVAADVAEGLETRTDPFVHLPLHQHPRFLGAPIPLVVVARAEGPMPSATSVRAALHEIDPRLPISDISTLDAQIGAMLMPQRLGSALLSVLAGLTLVLVTVGIVGTVSYGVSRRRREIGVRLALGAGRARVTSDMTRGAAVPVLVGLVAGTGAAYGLSRLVSGFLYGISPTDLPTFAISILVLGTMAGIAALVPAYRASGLNPTEVLSAD